MRRISTLLTVFSFLVALVSIAAGPMALGTATLIGAGYVDGKGVVFTFQVDGKVSRADMKGSVRVDGGANYSLDCVQQDSDTVKCTASKAVAGNHVVVTWGGSTFWTYVHGIPSQYCYGIYDWDAEPTTEWVNYGSHCQSRPAGYGDIINWDNRAWEGEEFEFIFLPESPDQDVCLGRRSGDAFYFPACGL